MEPKGDDEMSESVPINEAEDMEVLDALRDHVIVPLREAWAQALQAGAPIAAQGASMPPAQLEAALAPLWKDAWGKIESAEYIVSHLRYRINHLRGKGIMPGDIRETKLLKAGGP